MSIWKNDAINDKEKTCLYNLNTPSEMRKFSYAYMIRRQNGQYLIVYNMAYYTVDEANKLYSEYVAEGSEKASEISVLIKEAKDYIRELYK